MRTIRKKHRDSQRDFPAAACALCGGELYRGEVCWRMNGRLLCQDCVVPWLLDELAPCRIRLKEAAR